MNQTETKFEDVAIYNLGTGTPDLVLKSDYDKLKKELRIAKLYLKKLGISTNKKKL